MTYPSVDRTIVAAPVLIEFEPFGVIVTVPAPVLISVTLKSVVSMAAMIVANKSRVTATAPALVNSTISF